MSEKILGGFIVEGDITYAGKHLLIDCYDCEVMPSPEEIDGMNVLACKATGATVLFHHMHAFDGGGASGIVVLQESHLSCHGWVLEKFAAYDIFVCGDCDPYKVIPFIENLFKPGRMTVKLEKRGVI